MDLPDRISIDGGGDKGRFLPNMRTRFPDAPPHLSVAAALAAVAPHDQACLVSHGMEGRVNAGRGQKLVPPVREKHFSLFNQDFWKAEIDRLRETPELLVIFACNTGAGNDGAQLVFELAHALNATVQAPTGYVWSDDETKEPFLAEGADWQEATPAMEVPPPVLRAARLAAIDRPRETIVLWHAERLVALPAMALTNVRIRRREGDARIERWYTASANVIRDVLAKLALDQPLTFGGALATFVTGRMFVDIRIFGQEITREFLIHNDQLLEDSLAPGTFYEMDLVALLPLLTPVA